MQTSITLSNNVKMPTLGLGVWAIPRNETEQAVLWALEVGYRHIDTARVYTNEKEVGSAIRKSGIPRNEIFVTTKLWNDDQGYETGLSAFELSLEKLQMDYVDQYLVHWPYINFDMMKPGDPSKRKESWQAMEEIYKSGRAKSIGVSNFLIQHLEEMKSYMSIAPMANQIEFHPFWFRKELMDYCHKNNIVVVDYCPLVRGRKMDDIRISAIAKKYNKSNAQVLIRWGIQHGNVVIPKSSNQKRIQENFNVYDFELSADDMNALNSLNEDMTCISFTN